ncbi:hypothetical protein GGU11DRAFT_751694 [Lentinula aff. detonsa]|uniref:Uncharacterized protein n=1 Tax=Lentinula aff. detonsa TaxID=2804958 RepID=A0AA38L274_9AGAR|nr:hypothetical protein GGU10DRAFT_382117 [Lentinula aff. detonsa]KAJ3791482.1 hypothetical protein GGU11DRAFT_751694 [Lentinula aff. detonsa]
MLSKKERASSAPVFPPFRDVPRVDIRDFPTSPTRRPLHSREPNFRITFGSLFPLSKALESIPDEAKIPATPTPTDRLVPTGIHAAPLSPLTPLPKNSLIKKLAEADANTEDRFAASGWGQSNEVSQNNGSTSNYRPKFRYRARCSRQTFSDSSSPVYKCHCIFIENQILRYATSCCPGKSGFY